LDQQGYADGKLLETITLNNCTTAGLIHAGVLPKPALWEEHQAVYPAIATLEAEFETTESEVMMDQILDDKIYELLA
jgi:hypothetical protein